MARCGDRMFLESDYAGSETSEGLAMWSAGEPLRGAPTPDVDSQEFGQNPKNRLEIGFRFERIQGAPQTLRIEHPRAGPSGRC